MIHIKSNRLFFDNLSTEDSELIRYFGGSVSEQGEHEQELLEIRFWQALRVGVIAMERAQTQINLDAIRAEFDKLHEQTQNLLRDVFEGDQGKMAVILSKYLGEGGKLDDLFDPDRESSALGRIKSLLKVYFDGNDSSFGRLLDHQREGTPIFRFYKAIYEQYDVIFKSLNDLHGLLGKNKGISEASTLGTQQGFAFEEVVANLLDNIGLHPIEWTPS